MNATNVFSLLCLVASISLIGCSAQQGPQVYDEATKSEAQRGVGSVYIRSEEHLNEVIAQGNVVVDFYSDGCGPCVQLLPIIDEVARELPSVTFAKVNTGNLSPLANRYGVRRIPALFFFKDGQQIHMSTGLMSKTALMAQVKQLFSL